MISDFFKQCALCPDFRILLRVFCNWLDLPNCINSELTGSLNWLLTRARGLFSCGQVKFTEKSVPTWAFLAELGQH